MRNIRNKILLLVGFLLIGGIASFPINAQKGGRPKNTGILTVKTSPVAYSVNVDGQYMGMSGVGDPNQFYLTPGTHRMEVLFPNGKTYVKDIEVFKNKRNCVCLSYSETEIRHPCPYDITVEGPSEVIEGDLVTFVAQNRATDSPNPVKYQWAVSPGAKILSGLGTESITVDTKGMGDQSITAEVVSTDGYYDEKCRQLNTVSTVVKRPPEPPSPLRYDEFISVSFDDDKAHLDALAIELQNRPDTQAYIILYQGIDKNSRRLRNVEKVRQRALDYLVNSRGIDVKSFWIVEGGTRDKTTYEIWLIPPGAQPPVPR